MGVSGQLGLHRMDGTLLRAKAVPQGMIGYLVARVVRVFLDGLPTLLILVPGLILLAELAEAGLTGWLTMAWVIPAGTARHHALGGDHLWLGLGMRSVLLPDAAVAAEIGDSWRTLETIGVLGVWAVVGLLLAPPILRRMARRESGSAMEARRKRAMQEWGG